MWTSSISLRSERGAPSPLRQRIPFILEIIGTILILLVPILLSGNAYGLRLVLDVAILSILALSLTLIFGFTGQISLGQAAFYALGAYASAIVQTKLGVPFYIAWVFAILLTMLIAWLVSLPLLRISGHFLALGTLALGLIVETLLIHLVDLTGGTSGIMLPKAEYVPPFVSNFPFVIVVFFAIAYWLVRNLTNRGVGRALFALRDDPAGAAALGIPVTRYKTLIFAIGGGLAASAGILYGHHAQVITPNVFSFHSSITVLLVVVIGGMSSRFGAIIGALIVTLIPEWLKSFLAEGDNLAYGLIVLVVLLFLPGGVVGGLRSLWDLAKRFIARNGASA